MLFSSHVALPHRVCYSVVTVYASSGAGCAASNSGISSTFCGTCHSYDVGELGVHSEFHHGEEGRASDAPDHWSERCARLCGSRTWDQCSCLSGGNCFCFRSHGNGRFLRFLLLHSLRPRACGHDRKNCCGIEVCCASRTRSLH